MAEPRPIQPRCILRQRHQQRQSRCRRGHYLTLVQRPNRRPNHQAQTRETPDVRSEKTRPSPGTCLWCRVMRDHQNYVRADFTRRRYRIRRSAWGLSRTEPEPIDLSAHHPVRSPPQTAPHRRNDISSAQFKILEVLVKILEVLGAYASENFAYLTVRITLAQMIGCS